MWKPLELSGFLHSFDIKSHLSRNKRKAQCALTDNASNSNFFMFLLNTLFKHLQLWVEKYMNMEFDSFG